MEESGIAIGIYFGEDDLIMARVRTNDLVVLENQDSEPVTPAVVYMTEEYEPLVGKLAKDYGSTDPENAVSGLLQFLGREFTDPAVQQKLGRACYEAHQAQNGEVEIRLRGKNYPVIELAAFLLASLKRDAEAYTDQLVTQVVMTIPSGFNSRQKEAVRDAAQAAGLQVLRLVSEPTAVVMSYGMDQEAGDIQKLLVYDLSQGRFDASVLFVINGKVTKVAWVSLEDLGGNAFTQIIVNWLAEQVRMQYQVDIAASQDGKNILQVLRTYAEGSQAKLVKFPKVSIRIPALMRINDRPVELVCELTREQYESMIRSCVDRTLETVNQVLDQAHVSQDDISQVLVVGNAARTPLIQQRLAGIFGGRVLAKPERLIFGKAMGAALATQFMPKESTVSFAIEVPSQPPEPAALEEPVLEEPQHEAVVDKPVEEAPVEEVKVLEIPLEPVLCSCGVLNPVGRATCCFCGENLAEQAAKAAQLEEHTPPVEKPHQPAEPEPEPAPQALKEEDHADENPSKPIEQPPARPPTKKKSSDDSDKTLIDMDRTMMHRWDEEQ